MIFIRENITVTMMTKHPDSAQKYVPVQKKAEEAIEALKVNSNGLLGLG